MQGKRKEKRKGEKKNNKNKLRERASPAWLELQQGTHRTKDREPLSLVNSNKNNMPQKNGQKISKQLRCSLMRSPPSGGRKQTFKCVTVASFGAHLKMYLHMWGCLGFFHFGFLSWELWPHHGTQSKHATSLRPLNQ